MRLLLLLCIFYCLENYTQNNEIKVENTELFSFLEIELSKDNISLKRVKTLLNKNFNTITEKIEYLNQLTSLSKFRENKFTIAHIYFICSDFYFNLDKDKKFFELINKAKIIYSDKPIKYNKQLSVTYSMIASKNLEKKNYNVAIEYYQKIINEISHNGYVLLAKMNIAEIYILTKKIDIAKVYLEEVFEYYKTKTPEGLNHTSLAYPYLYRSYYPINYNEKLNNVNKGIELMIKRNQPRNLTQAYRFRANLYYDYKKHDLAITDYKTALNIAKENKFTYYIIENYQFLSKIYLRQNQPKIAKIYLDSTKIFIRSSDLNFKFTQDSLAYVTHTMLGNYKKANAYAQRFIKHQDSLIHNSKDSLYIAYGKKYQTDKKIQENELLVKDNVIKDLEVKKQITNRNYLILFSVLSVIILGFIFNRYRVKRKLAKLLEVQNTLIGSQKIELEKANANKQKLFSIIAHDLINPFNAILGYTKLLNDDYDDFKELERKKFINIINKYATNNYNLTKTLLDWARIQQKSITVKKENLNCLDIVNMAIKPYLILADKKQININLEILENITVIADNNMMQTVIGNLFVNAVKFTPKKGQINLTLNKLENGTVQLEIEDNGIGMSQKQLNSLFDISKVNTSNGTDNENGSGLGLILCKEFMDMQNGTLNFLSELSKGSRAIITI